MMVAARHEVEDDVVPYVLINEMSRTSYEYKQILGI